MHLTEIEAIRRVLHIRPADCADGRNPKLKVTSSASDQSRYRVFILDAQSRFVRAKWVGQVLIGFHVWV